MNLTVNNGVFPVFTKTVKKNAVYDTGETALDEKLLLRYPYDPLDPDVSDNDGHVPWGWFAYRTTSSSSNPMTDWIALEVSAGGLEFKELSDGSYSDREGWIVVNGESASARWTARYSFSFNNKVLRYGAVWLTRNSSVSTEHQGKLLYDNDYNVVAAAELTRNTLHADFTLEDRDGNIQEVTRTWDVSYNGVLAGASIYSVFGVGDAIFHPGQPNGFHRTRLSPDLKVEFKPQGGEN